MRLVLFDIDGTLIDSSGAGRRALEFAMSRHFGLSKALATSDLAGKTDPLIVREALRRAGREEDMDPAGLSAAFLDTYCASLREELRACNGFRVLAGVRELLQLLSENRSFRLGIATGNIAEGARLKLEKARLQDFFGFGGFGCDAEIRRQLILRAVERGGGAAEKVFVIGDTPHDIVHGREAGALTIAVASGFYSLDELREHDPDLLLNSLQPIQPVLDFLYT